MNCKNCSAEVSLNYCANCGEPVKLKRINGHYIIHEIEHVLHFEKGILYTIRELLLRPGKNISHFLSENRTRLVKPIIFIIVSSLLYTVASHFFHINDGYVRVEVEKTSAIAVISKWVKEHYGYSNIMMGIFIALWLKLFFRKYNYNFYEILILLCFLMGMGMLLLTFFAVFQGLTHLDVMQTGGYVFIIYSTWAIGQFFDRGKPLSYINAFISYLLGMITFWSGAFIIGALIGFIIKH